MLIFCLSVPRMMWTRIQCYFLLDFWFLTSVFCLTYREISEDSSNWCWYSASVPQGWCGLVFSVTSSAETKHPSGLQRNEMKETCKLSRFFLQGGVTNVLQGSVRWVCVLKAGWSSSLLLGKEKNSSRWRSLSDRLFEWWRILLDSCISSWCCCGCGCLCGCHSFQWYCLKVFYCVTVSWSILECVLKGAPGRCWDVSVNPSPLAAATQGLSSVGASHWRLTADGLVTELVLYDDFFCLRLRN